METNQSLAIQALDADAEMSNVQEMNNQVTPPPDNSLPQTTNRANTPSTSLAIRIPGRASYANALKRTAEQAGNQTPEQGNSDVEVEQDNHSETEGQENSLLRWPQKTTSGPIKGFNNDKVFENLDRQVREAWERRAQEAVFVYYMDGGYSPNIAQNVHAIAEDLKSKRPKL